MVSPSNRKPEIRVQFIRGYLELDMLAEARAELKQIAPADRDRLDVMEVSLELAMRTRAWKQVIQFGEQMARAHPEIEQAWIGWAYALRELKRIEEARAVLLKAEPLHGKKSAVLHFNLACYYALLGEPKPAQKHLDRACKLEPKFKQEALSDPDLASLR